MKKILILGGTNFIGRVLVKLLLQQAKHDITLFNRGRRNADLFPELPKIIGDRETDDYLKISEQNWDVIIDLSGYFPDSFQKLVDSLKGKLGRYIFVSTISVFDIESLEGTVITENTTTMLCSEEQKRSKLSDAYGEKKAEMERILLGQTDFDKIIIRPSFVYGQYDFTDRFYYWLWRSRTKEKVLIPEDCKNFGLTEVNQLAQGIARGIDMADHQPIYNAVTFAECSIPKIVAEGRMDRAQAIEQVEFTQKMVEAQKFNGSEFPLYSPVSFVVNNTSWLNDFKLENPEKLVSEDLVQYYNQLDWYEPKIGLKWEKEAELLNLL